MTRALVRPQTQFEGALESLGFEKYADYLQSEHWLHLKRKYAARRCYACDGYPCHLHHCTYVRLGREEMSDLVSLCQECHTKVHELVKAKKAALHSAHEILRQKLGAVNKPKKAKKQRKPRVPRTEKEKARRAALRLQSKAVAREQDRAMLARRKEQQERQRNYGGHDPSSPFRYLKSKP